MEKLRYLWDEFDILDKKKISLQVFDGEEDLESDPCLPNTASSRQKPRKAGNMSRAGDILDCCGL